MTVPASILPNKRSASERGRVSSEITLSGSISFSGSHQLVQAAAQPVGPQPLTLDQHEHHERQRKRHAEVGRGQRQSEQPRQVGQRHHHDKGGKEGKAPSGHLRSAQAAAQRMQLQRPQCDPLRGLMRIKARPPACRRWRKTR